jgi:glycosyltransferase involved in cell wall biosynthesis
MSVKKKKKPEKQKRRIPVVMQVIPRLGAGGAEQGCIDVAAELVRSGAKAIVVSNGGGRVRELQRIGAQHIDLPVDSKNPITIWRNIARLRAVIEKHGVDIVHARSRAPAWSCIKACEGTGARFMTTCHAFYNTHGSKWKERYNSVMAKGERVIAISYAVAEYLKNVYGADPARIRVIPRGIDPDKFNPATVNGERIVRLTREWRVPDGAGVILLPGRLTRWKGQLVMIEAMALLCREEKYKDYYCVLVGDDQGRTGYREELEDLITGRGLEERVRIAEHCEDMPAALMLASAVVSASTDPEGFGRVAVEAQAMGRPIVATDHGGSQETVLPNGETGWLVPPGDANALAAALRAILDLQEEEKSALAYRAITHVMQHFTVSHMTAATLDVYAELINEAWGIAAPSDSAQKAA